MSKYEGHTPAPWKAEKSEASRYIITGIANDGSDEICEINTNWVKPSSAEANAKLIADAPMLAERVEEQEQIINQYAGVITAATNKITMLAERVEALMERVDCLTLALDGSDKTKDKLAEQNENMLAMLKEALCELNKRGYTGGLNALIAEIEGEK